MAAREWVDPVPPPRIDAETIYTSNSELSDDDMTEEMSYNPPTHPYVPSYMASSGLLCGPDMPYHGLLPAAIQDVWRSFHPGGRDNYENLSFVMHRFSVCLENVAFDARKVAEDFDKNRGQGEDIIKVTSHFSGLGYQAIAFGLWACLFGPYSDEHVLDVVESVCDQAQQCDRERLPSWILGLSMGMEHHNVINSPSWRLIQHHSPQDVEIIPGWPTHSIAIPTNTPRAPAGEPVNLDG